MSDFDSSYDSGEDTSGENANESIDVSESEIAIDVGTEENGAIDISEDDNLEIEIPSGPIIGTEIATADENEKNSFANVGGSKGDNPGEIYVGDENNGKNATINIEGDQESKAVVVSAEENGEVKVETTIFEGEEKINEYLESLSEKDRAKQIEALSKMTEDERSVYAENLENEPQITATMEEIAQNNGAELAGLEYRVKTPSSAYGKMYDRDEPTDIKDMNDIIRYTEIYTGDNLAEGANASLQELESRGFEVVSVKNTWDVENATYRGINTVVRDPSGQTFELQFHTQESFDLKNGELHELYEERRTMADDDPRAIEIDEKMIELSSKLERPKNVHEVKKI